MRRIYVVSCRDITNGSFRVVRAYTDKQRAEGVVEYLKDGITRYEHFVEEVELEGEDINEGDQENSNV
jgi:hypothetical protein